MSQPSTMPNRFGRSAALTVLGFFLLALAAIAIGPHLWSYELARQVDEKAEAARRLEAEALRLGDSKKRLAALSNPEIANTMLLEGATSGLNGAHLQKQITEISRGAGISLSSLRVADPQDWKEGLRNITLEIGMQANLQQLQDFLFAVETRLPLMFIEDMTAAHPQAVAGSANGPLEVNIKLRGIALSGDAQ